MRFPKLKSCELWWVPVDSGGLSKGMVHLNKERAHLLPACSCPPDRLLIRLLDIVFFFFTCLCTSWPPGDSRDGMPDQPGVPLERPGANGADVLTILRGEGDRGSKRRDKDKSVTAVAVSYTHLRAHET